MGLTLPGAGSGGSSVASAALVPTAVKTANYTAAASDYVPVDTTSGGVTVTLPTAPADKTQIGVKHVVRGGTNVVTIACGGSDVLNKTGGATSGTLTLLNQGAVLQYKASGAIWYVVGDDTPLSQLDARYPLLGTGTPSAGYVPTWDAASSTYKPQAQSLSSSQGAAPNALTGSPAMAAYFKASSIAQSDGTAVSSWTDSSGNGNTVTQATGANQPLYKVAASVPWLNGNPAVRFDGTNDFLSKTSGVTCPSLTSFCIGAVVYYPDGGNNMGLAVLTNGGANDDLQFEGNKWTGRGGGATASITAGQWQITSGVHVIVLNYDGAQLQLYIDGRLMAWGAATGAITPNALYLGGLNATPAYPWKGDMAEVAIYSTALSQAQLDQLTRGWAYSYRLPIVNPF